MKGVGHLSSDHEVVRDLLASLGGKYNAEALRGGVGGVKYSGEGFV